MMARLMLSAGMLTALAAAIAVRRRGFASGSPPFLAAIVISLIRRVNILPRLASRAAFLCLIVAHLLCPDIEHLLSHLTFENIRDTRRMNRASKAIRNDQEDAFRQNAFRTGAKRESALQPARRQAAERKGTKKKV